MVLKLFDAFPRLHAEIPKVLRRMDEQYKEAQSERQPELVEKRYKVSASGRDAVEHELVMLENLPRLAGTLLMMAKSHNSRLEKSMVK